MKVAFAGPDHLIEDAVARTEAGGVRCPFRQSFTAQAQLLGKVRTPRARALPLHLGHDGGLKLEALERRQPELPPRGRAIHRLRVRREMDDGLSRDAVQSAVMKNDGITAYNGLVI